MTIKDSIMALAVAGAFAVPFAANAQGNTGALSQDDFSNLDVNNDGVISRGEWRQSSKTGPVQGGSQGASGQQQPQQQAQAAGQWVVVTVTPVEQRIMNEQRRESLFRALDANGNGNISAAEAGLNVQLLNAFAKLDQDRNSVIDRQEFASVHVQDPGQQQSGQQSQQSQSQGSASAGQSR